MKTEMYQRRTFTVEAIQVTEENLYDVAKWCEGDVRTNNGTKKKYIQLEVINPLEPKHSRASIGEWILKSNQGYKIYADAAFKKGWEKVGNVGQALQEAFASKTSGIEGTVLFNDGQEGT